MKTSKENSEAKKSDKKSTLKPLDDDFSKLDAKKILEQEEQEFDKFPSLAKLKELGKEKLKSVDENDENKISREILIPEVIMVQELAIEWQKTADVVKTLMKISAMAMLSTIELIQLN